MVAGRGISPRSWTCPRLDRRATIGPAYRRSNLASQAWEEGAVVDATTTVVQPLPWITGSVMPPSPASASAWPRLAGGVQRGFSRRAPAAISDGRRGGERLAPSRPYPVFGSSHRASARNVYRSMDGQGVGRRSRSPGCVCRGHAGAAIVQVAGRCRVEGAVVAAGGAHDCANRAGHADGPARPGSGRGWAGRSSLRSGRRGQKESPATIRSTRRCSSVHISCCHC